MEEQKVAQEFVEVVPTTTKKEVDISALIKTVAELEKRVNEQEVIINNKDIDVVLEQKEPLSIEDQRLRHLFSDNDEREKAKRIIKHVDDQIKAGIHFDPMI